jgi:predicted  nucleic acid-binding Zn-ribbon protein
MNNKDEDTEKRILTQVSNKIKQDGTTPEKKMSWEDMIQAKMQIAMTKLLDHEQPEKDDRSSMSGVMSELKEMLMFKTMMKMLQEDLGGGKKEDGEVLKLKEQIARMEADRVAEKQQASLNELKAEIVALKTNSSNNNPVLDKMMDKIESLQTEIQASREQSLKDQIAQIQQDTSNQIESLRDSLQYISSSKSESNDSPLSQLRKQVEEVESVKKLFGGNEVKEKDMSPAETIDFGLGMIPKAAEGIRSLTNVLKPHEPEDDVPPIERQSPNIPPPAAHPSDGISLSSDVMDYINSGQELNDGGVKIWKDAYGNMFLNNDGSLMSKQDVLRYARTSTEAFKTEMEKNTNIGREKSQKESQKEKVVLLPKRPATVRPATSEDVKKAGPPVPIPATGITVQPRRDLPPEIQNYIDRHKTTTATVNGKDGVLIGDYDEFWRDESGNPLSPNELEALMKSVPPDVALSQYHRVIDQAKQEREHVEEQPKEQIENQNDIKPNGEQQDEEEHSTGDQ